MGLGSSSNNPPHDDGEPRYGSSGNCGNNHLPRNNDEPRWSDSQFNQPRPPFPGEAGGKPRYAIGEDDCEPRYAIRGVVILSSIILLILVGLFVLLLCIYARSYWSQSARLSRRRSVSRRHRFHFTNQEPEGLRNVGLDSTVLQTLPVFVYKSQNFTDGLDCAVCLCELEENEKARLPPNCGHTFHVECIDMWFLSHSTCPLCRAFAQPERPVRESFRVEMASSTIRDSIPSVIHDNLNSEQGQTASCGQEYNRQNTANIFSCDVQKQMNKEKDEGTSGGRNALIMPQISIEIPNSPRDGFSFPGEGHQLCSPNGSQSASKSPVTLLRSFRNMLSRDIERIQVLPKDHPGECDVENNGPAHGQ